MLRQDTTGFRKFGVAKSDLLVMFPRSAGILLHISSLPGEFGIGDLGPDAYRFVDFLRDAHARYWQVLPLVPVGFGDSPYASPSTFAGNTSFVSPALLAQAGLLTEAELDNYRHPATSRVDFDAVRREKGQMISAARRRYFEIATADQIRRFDAFRADNASWLDDYSLFMAIKAAHGQRSWTDWPVGLRDRHEADLQNARAQLADAILDEQFGQFVFFAQWQDLKAYCGQQGIDVVGDVPIYVAHDSADVWANAGLFRLAADGRPTHVSGVPPDYFSEDGQRWGNPLYRWDKMEQSGFPWWVARMRAALGMYDVIRLDHFRGFEAYWEVPEHEATARNGRWVPGPGAALFDALGHHLGVIPIIAEDLGLITPGVRELKERYRYPGMAILQFAFDAGPDNSFLPHNYDRNLWAYTGTHDNETVRGWYEEPRSTQSLEVTEQARAYCRRYLGFADEQVDELHIHFLRALYASVADVVVAPVQDLLGLGADARMNEPGSVGSNWAWRLVDDEYTATAPLLKDLAETFGRSPGRG